MKNPLLFSIVILCILAFSSLTLHAQQQKIPKELIKLSKELEQQQIKSKVVTQNAKSVRSPLTKKQRSKQAPPKKVELAKEPLVNTSNATSESVVLPDPFESPMLTPTEDIIEETPKEDIDSGPFFHLGISLNTLPISAARINPANTISSWLGLDATIGFFSGSIGFSEFEENNLGDSGVNFFKSNTGSTYYLGNFLYDYTSQIQLSIGYFQIHTTGDYLYASIDSSTVSGFTLGVRYSLTDQFQLHGSWIPLLYHDYTLTLSEDYPDAFAPTDNDYEQTLTNAGFMFGLRYDLFSY